MKRAGRLVFSRIRVSLVAGLVVMVSAGHWWTPRGHDYLLVVHTALGKLYILPVVLAAIWFDLRFAVATAAVVTILFLPHIVFQWAGDRTENVNQVGEIVTIWVTAVLSGVFAGREKAALRRLAGAFEGIVETLVAALDMREHDTSEHSRRVRSYTLRMARELGVPPNQQREWALGALLHDIGKIGISDVVLLKPGPLDETEMEYMRRHPDFGMRILAPVALLHDAGEIIYAHHERFDGSGYPRGLAGEAIPLGARVFAVADVYDALTSKRPYREPCGSDEARQEIERGAGSMFDPDVVAAFLRIPSEEWQRVRQAHEAERENKGPVSVMERGFDDVLMKRVWPLGLGSLGRRRLQFRYADNRCVERWK